MTFSKRLLLFAVILITCLFYTLAAEAFVVHRIKVEGLQRISTATMRSYIPIHEGQKYTERRGEEIIASLYKTGFFNNVRLGRHGSVLIVHVVERPTIGLLKITGNEAIPAKKLRSILSDFGIVEGQPYDASKANQIVQGLEQQYAKMGYRAAVIKLKVVKAPRNRILVYFNIHEGIIAKVHAINFIGNHAFSSGKLRDQFKMTTRGLFTWIHHTDRYSPYKLGKDLQRLTHFYMNHGYLRFRITKKDVQLTKDKEGVYITITVSEGPVYRISGYKISGQTFGLASEMEKMVVIKRGDVFSRQAIINSNKGIGNFLANRGYAFAGAQIRPQINNLNHTVFVTFNVVPGHRVYVRRVSFFGNKHTDQEVLRREMRQYEAATYSLAKIKRSKQRLGLLSYFSDVKYSTRRVPGHPDQVDLNYHIKEVPAGKASLQGGFSSLYGFLYGANISEPNFMGSGRFVSLGFQNSHYTGNYSFRYNNPYYTTYGLSRGFSLYYSRVKPDSRFNLQSYLTNSFGIDVTYGYPVSERNYIDFGYGYENIRISDVNREEIAPSVLAFLGATAPGSSSSRTFNQFKLTGGWVYNGLDRAIFPTKGFRSSLGVELGAPIIKSSYGYYKTVFNAKYYQPLFSGFIFNVVATAGYGNGFDKDAMLPFYKNFYMGGIGTVPAYAPNSLGPLNLFDNVASIGGNLEALVGVHLILPDFISEKVRTAIIFDAGNVFQARRFPGDIKPQIIENNKFALENLRLSLGLAVEWYTPLAPINVTLAFPLGKERQGDNPQPFQFSFGLSI